MNQRSHFRNEFFHSPPLKESGGGRRVDHQLPSNAICPAAAICRELENDWANARLIAAAPELLEALKLARKVMSVACGEEAPYIREAYARIDPVIDRAEGREQKSDAPQLQGGAGTTDPPTWRETKTNFKERK